MECTYFSTQKLQTLSLSLAASKAMGTLWDPRDYSLMLGDLVLAWFVAEFTALSLQTPTGDQTALVGKIVSTHRPPTHALGLINVPTSSELTRSRYFEGNSRGNYVLNTSFSLFVDWFGIDRVLGVVAVSAAQPARPNSFASTTPLCIPLREKPQWEESFSLSKPMGSRICDITGDIIWYTFPPASQEGLAALFTSFIWIPELLG